MAATEDSEAPGPSSWVRSYSVSSQGASPLHSPKVAAVEVEAVQVVEEEAHVPTVQVDEAPAAPTAVEADVTAPVPPPVEIEVTQVDTEPAPAPTIAIIAEEQEPPAPVEPVIILSTELKEPDVPIESPVWSQSTVQSAFFLTPS